MFVAIWRFQHVNLSIFILIHFNRSSPMCRDLCAGKLECMLSKLQKLILTKGGWKDHPVCHFDNSPFLVGETKQLDCQFGPNKKPVQGKCLWLQSSNVPYTYVRMYQRTYVSSTVSALRCWDKKKAIIHRIRQIINLYTQLHSYVIKFCVHSRDPHGIGWRQLYSLPIRYGLVHGL